MPSGPVAVACFVLAASPQAADEDYVRLVLETPASTPYSVLRYEVTRRGRATSAAHRRKLPGHPESLQGMGLLTKEEETALWALLLETHALDLPDAVQHKPMPGALTWRVELQIDGHAHAFRVTDPINHRASRDYARLFLGVRSLVLRLAGEIPFRNVFYSAGDLGWLNVVTIPSARVEIDGFDTRHDTPLYGYEVSAGEHAVRLRSLDGAYDRQYKVRVEPAGTTQLRVDLR